jgi:hypothetical protein
MTRERKSVAEIEALLLEDVRRQRHCSEVADIVIGLCPPQEDNHGANWQVVSVDPGGASREFAGAAVLVSMGRLQQEVDAIEPE